MPDRIEDQQIIIITPHRMGIQPEIDFAAISLRPGLKTGQRPFGHLLEIEKPQRDRTVRSGKVFEAVTVGHSPAAVAVERGMSAGDETADRFQISAVQIALADPHALTEKIQIHSESRTVVFPVRVMTEFVPFLRGDGELKVRTVGFE